VHPAVGNQGVYLGAALASFFTAEEEPVLLAQCRGPDRVFDEVVVDLCLAVFVTNFSLIVLFPELAS
jgi:hypothetical protein